MRLLACLCVGCYAHARPNPERVCLQIHPNAVASSRQSPAASCLCELSCAANHSNLLAHKPNCSLRDPRAGPQPDWAGLPGDLWRFIVLLAHPNWDERREWHQITVTEAQSRAVVQTSWCKPLLAVSAVCWSLRSAMRGPEAGLLWDDLHYQSTYKALAPRGARQLWAALRPRSSHEDVLLRSRRLTQLLVQQGQGSWSATLWGGGWVLPELQEVSASLAGLTFRLQLMNMNDTGEAACIGAAIARSRVQRLLYFGNAAFAFPVRLRALKLCLSGASAAEAQQLFACLQPLSELTSLYLGLGRQWRMTTADAESLVQWLPQLQRLVLRLSIPASGQQHAVAPLKQLVPFVDITVVVAVIQDSRIARGDFTDLLQQLSRLLLTELQLVCPSKALTAAAEQQLAYCKVQEQLTLCLEGAPARRLPRVPAATCVVYETHEQPIDFCDTDEVLRE